MSGHFDIYLEKNGINDYVNITPICRRLLTVIKNMIKMIKSDANTRVLSSPHIMTADNEEAKIVVGEKVFFRSSEINPTPKLASPVTL